MSLEELGTSSEAVSFASIHQAPQSVIIKSAIRIYHLDDESEL